MKSNERGTTELDQIISEANQVGSPTSREWWEYYEREVIRRVLGPVYDKGRRIGSRGLAMRTVTF